MFYYRPSILRYPHSRNTATETFVHKGILCGQACLGQAGTSEDIGKIRPSIDPFLEPCQFISTVDSTVIMLYLYLHDWFKGICPGNPENLMYYFCLPPILHSVSGFNVPFDEFNSEDRSNWMTEVGCSGSSLPRLAMPTMGF